MTITWKLWIKKKEQNSGSHAHFPHISIRQALELHALPMALKSLEDNEDQSEKED